MARRHRLTDREMLKGVRRALANPKTPSHFRPGLRRLEERLESRIARVKSGKKDWLSQFFE
jgi:hypothetical protein